MWWLALVPCSSASTEDPVVQAEIGQGVTVTGRENASLQVRGRAQLRGEFDAPLRDGDPEALFQVRRLRIMLLGKLPAHDLQLYIQLAFSPLDMEPDLLVPLRDAFVTWTPLRDLGFKFGQQKVPFNRERVVSSSALQFADRTVTNAELSLDRDVGLQLFSNDLFGWNGRLGYQLGVFNGDGRNRTVGDLGLLWVARLEFRSGAHFDDAYVEGDLERGRPRLAIGAGVARNVASPRARSTLGPTYQLGGFTQDHAQADIVAKGYGASLHAQVIARAADRDRREGIVDGAPLVETSRSAWGASFSVGYVLPGDLEPAVRVAWVEPLPGRASEVQPERELRGGLSWYIHGHDLKWQSDIGYVSGQAHPDGSIEVRSQVQVFF